MLYRRFGRTELSMPVISCGGMRYQHKWQDVPLGEVPPENQANLEATIRRSVELGIHHIETARGYGSSERQLGQVLPSFDRGSIIVQTKIGPHESADEFTRGFEDSLARLRLGYVDLLSIHGINDRVTLEQSIRKGGCLEAARRIQKRGLARHIGFSTHAALDVILDAIGFEGGGDVPGFDYVNLHWYYIFQHNWPAVLEATRRDMGVFIISPSDKGGMLYRPPAKLVELCRPLHPIVFNDLFCLWRGDGRQEGRVHTLSVGAARPSDFDLHVRATEMLDRADELLPPILERLREAYEAAVEPELRDPFDLGLPGWEDAPGRMHLPVMLWLRNLARAYDLVEYGKMRYNLLGNGGHWFPGMNALKLAETDLGEVSRRCGLGDRLEGMIRQTHEMLWKEPVKRVSEGG